MINSSSSSSSGSGGGHCGGGGSSSSSNSSSSSSSSSCSNLIETIDIDDSVGGHQRSQRLIGLAIKKLMLPLHLTYTNAFTANLITFY